MMFSPSAKLKDGQQNNFYFEIDVKKRSREESCDRSKLSQIFTLFTFDPFVQFLKNG